MTVAMPLLTKAKSFCETSVQLKMELKKGQEQGRDGRTQEYYLISEKIHSKCWVVFLHSFISALFLSFSLVYSYVKLAKKVSPQLNFT